MSVRGRDDDQNTNLEEDVVPTPLPHRTNDKRYLSDLTTALRLRNISGARIGEIVAEIEVHTAESGESAVEAFGPAKEYSRQFEPTADERASRRWGPVAWVCLVTAALGGWLLAGGVTSGMSGETELGLPGWWAAVIGAVILLGTFCFVPVDAIIDPRRPNAQRFGRGWLIGMVALSAAVVVLILIGLMLITG
jgi:hypothetical protein